jgi:hypothetical protein
VTLTFDEPTHTYRYGGVVRPSVTQVLEKLHDFSMVPKDVLEAACERGTYVHLLTQYHDEGDLATESIGDYWPYLDAWIKFCAAHKAKWDDIEWRHYSKRYGYAGTMDRRGTLDGVRYIVDVKTSASPHRVWGMQTAAYRQLAAEEDPKWLLARRATVQLRPENGGTYKFLAWDDPDDWGAFLSLINLTNWANKQ